MQSYPIVKDLVLLGGGHSHVTVLKSFGMKPLPGLQITLISPDVRTPYSGMLPGFIAGHYSEDDIHIDLVALCRFAGAKFILDRAIGVDAVYQQVQTINHPAIDYDVLSIDIGITPSLAPVPGAAKNVIPVKPIHQFIDRWTDFRRKVLTDEIRKVGVVGGGAGGVELCLAIRHRLLAESGGGQDDKPSVDTSRANPVEFHLFSDGPILQGYNKAVSKTFVQIFDDRNISRHEAFRVASVEDKQLISDKGEVFALDEIFWVTTAASQSWLRASELSCDDDGFITVGATLQTLSHPNVFAAGDIAQVVDHPRPKAGVFAVRQGPPLNKNIRLILQGEKTRPFKPQTKFLALISTGEKHAVASRGNYQIEGKWVWYWKNWIDKNFVEKFNKLPEMSTSKSGGLVSGPDDEMHCGGCGAKLGADVLASILSEVKIRENTDVVMGIDKADDASVVRVPAGHLLVQSTDHFRSFIEDPYIFAKIGVCHALSDVYAMGVAPKTALASVTLPFGRPDKLQGILKQIMFGVVEGLSEEGVTLVGGHTGEGAEMSLGFTVNGYAKASELWCKKGMQDGDSLILTKSLGSGALFAADMKYKAKGQWIKEAVDQMLQSNRQAMEIFKTFGINACTDITGFGLAGHLIEMLEASRVDAEINLDDLPVMAGAGKVINQLGITSSLHESNRLNERNMGNLSAWQHHRNYHLLFDPQTSGGLLASVSPEQAHECAGELSRQGYRQVGIVGRVIKAACGKVALNLTGNNASG